MRRQPWALAIIYMVVSLAVEAALMVLGHLKVPQGNAILAPAVLSIPPLLAAVGSLVLTGILARSVAAKGALWLAQARKPEWRLELVS